MIDITLNQAIKKAKSLKDVGQTSIYLFKGPYPWAYVTKVEKGASYRLNACTSVSFKATHPCGLEFRWTVDLEEADADGRGYFMMKPERMQEIMVSIPEGARRGLKVLIREAADALQLKADEWKEVYENQRDAASAFRELVKLY